MPVFPNGVESWGVASHLGNPSDLVSLDMRFAKRSAGVPGHRSGLKSTLAYRSSMDVKGKGLKAV